ncbi:MAG: glycosyltransferase [Cyclobacterium sp.]|uniref:glycosyltransferase n=1 Tax=unclassified Cyclobacterium TaxID=2615055 RepID=UPI0013CFE16F|nr:glycosyltransferase [Cyclobacterium sp. SYSU L10401]
MKVLQVVGSMHPTSGGVSQGIRNIVPALREKGVHNEIVCMDDPNTANLDLEGFTVHCLGPATTPWSYSSNLLPWLRDNLKKFDAVIVNGLWLYPGFAVVKALSQIRGEKPPLFVMPHGMLDPYFQKANGRKLKAIRNWVYWKLIEQKLIHKAAGLLFTCEQELILARNTFSPYQPAKELNVGYGIPEPPPYTPQMAAVFHKRCQEIKHRPYLLFLSRIHEKKGVDLLIRAYSQLIDKDFQGQLPLLVIAGPGMDTGYGRQLQDMVDENPKLKKAIIFPGMLTGELKWAAFYGCEAFVLPSHQENFGIAVVEALACGKPVLISDQVNIWKEISDSEGGLIAKDNQKGVTDQLKRWGQLSSDQKETMGKQAEKCFQNYFSIQQAAHKIIHALYETSA